MMYKNLVTNFTYKAIQFWRTELRGTLRVAQAQDVSGRSIAGRNSELLF